MGVIWTSRGVGEGWMNHPHAVPAWSQAQSQCWVIVWESELEQSRQLSLKPRGTALGICKKRRLWAGGNKEDFRMMTRLALGPEIQVWQIAGEALGGHVRHKTHGTKPGVRNEHDTVASHHTLQKMSALHYGLSSVTSSPTDSVTGPISPRWQPPCYTHTSP